MRSLLAIFALPFALAVAGAAEIEIDSGFDPNPMAANATGTYSIVIEERSSESLPDPQSMNRIAAFPEVEGLEFRNGRTSRSREIESVNSRTTYIARLKLVFDVVASSTGSYTVPSFQIDYKGETRAVPAAELEVTDRAPATGRGAPVDELVFLEASLPEQLYVGESVRVELRLFVSQPVTLADYGDFRRSADGFLVSDRPKEPETRQARRNGRLYRVFSWPLKVTAISAGQHTLSYQFDVVARMPSEGRDPGRSRGPFDSFFDRAISRPQRFTLRTEKQTAEVEPLPERNRPDSFTGGIGDFSLEAYAQADKSQVGDPVTLSVEISGSGNFSRIEAPKIEAGPEWRVYSPEVAFDATDDLGLAGTKSFDYVLVPQKAGELETPPVRFAFFDPEDPGYHELEGPPMPVKVEPGARRMAQGTNGEAPGTGAAKGQGARAPEARFALDPSSDEGRSLGPPIWTRPSFVVAQAGLAALLAGGAFVARRRQRREEDPAYAVRETARKTLREARRRYARAEREGDTEAFLRAASDAARIAASRHAGRWMTHASAAELEALFEARDERARAALRRFLETAERAAFSGQPAAVRPRDLPALRADLETAIGSPRRRGRP